MLDPPHRIEPDLCVAEDPRLDELMPADAKAPFDVREVIRVLADGGDFLEVMEAFTANIS